VYRRKGTMLDWKRNDAVVGGLLAYAPDATCYTIYTDNSNESKLRVNGVQVVWFSTVEKCKEQAEKLERKKQK